MKTSLKSKAPREMIFKPTSEFIRGSSLELYCIVFYFHLKSKHRTSEHANVSFIDAELIYRSLHNPYFIP